MTLLQFDNTYADQLGDLAAEWAPTDVPAPRLLRFNEPLARELGLDVDAWRSTDTVRALAGAAVIDGATPISQAYAGHQFGSFNPQLGDGRAVLLGEGVTPDGHRFDLALKGSGRTPFSRGGDGKSALGPVLREYLIGEAMHALGVPTTRALAAVTTGEMVRRETMLPGAVLTRAASSHLRVGTFQFVAARGNTDVLTRLVDYTIARHDPDLADADVPALALLDAVIARQTSLIATWMSLGFIHGVMNTDNTTISGETIDYGPCAFMEAFDPNTVFSSIDHGGRYAYGNQPSIGLWNMARLAEALLPIIDANQDRSVELATEVLDTYHSRYETAWRSVMRHKLGLRTDADDDPVDALIAQWLGALQSSGADWTLAHRHLSAAGTGDEAALRSTLASNSDQWFASWRELLDDGAAAQLGRVNPLYVPRNHLVEAALDAAVMHDDLDPFDRLLERVTAPFDATTSLPVEVDEFATPAPEGFEDGYRTFCGT